MKDSEILEKNIDHDFNFFFFFFFFFFGSLKKGNRPFLFIFLLAEHTAML